MGNLKKVFVGFSVNPELVLRLSAEEGFEKTIGSSYQIGFSGSSANIASALGLWGVNTTLLGLVGINRSHADEFLDIGLQNSAVPFQRIPILTETSFATVLANEQAGNSLIGFKGKVVPAEMSGAIERITQTLNSDAGFRVASGATEDQALLFKAFWGEEFVGFRTFCPHKSLLLNKEAFLSLCSFADMVIMNSSELRSSELRIADIHRQGTRLVIITDGDQGGIFSLSGKSVNYSAKKVQGAFGTGAGDWFHAMVVCFMRDHTLDFSNASLSDVEEAINFSSQVVAKKVTYPGGAEGPARNEFVF